MAGKISYRKFGIVKAAGYVRYGVVSAITTLTVTRTKHAGRTVRLDLATGFTSTLPASTGSGDVYRFVCGTALTSTNSYIIKVANATDVMAGGIDINDSGDTTAATNDFFPTAASSDTITILATNGGGKIGDWVELEDLKTGFWAVHGQLQGMTDPATPFSASV